MEKSREALKILISGESNAVKTYELYAQTAAEEGYGNIARLFDALSKAERIHIKNHLHALDEEYTPVPVEVKSKTTMENIQAAIEGESEEAKKLYPRFIRQIRSECRTEYGKVAKLSMTWAQKAEKEHARLLKKALKALKSGSDLVLEKIYLCQVCGNIVLDDLQGKECDVCGHDIQFFNIIRRES